MKIFAILLFALACFLIYLSHNNQTLMMKPLKISRYIAILIGGIAVSMLSYCLDVLVAIFMCMVTAIMVWSFTPLIFTLKRYVAYESEKSSKNPS